MSRLPPLPPEQMSPQQRSVHDAIVSGPRGAVHHNRSLRPGRKLRLLCATKSAGGKV